MKKWHFIFLFCNCYILTHSQTTGVNTNWILGYGSYWGAAYGHTLMDFNSGAPTITYDSLEMDINRTSANISDTNGNILFYTNGYYIADVTGDTMQNGNTISPTGFNLSSPSGLTVPQACLALPQPGSSHLYYLFHSTVDNAPNYNRALNFYYSVIDMNLNGGKGAVTSKNVVILQDTLIAGNITACKHANGRDWWVIVQQANSNLFYKYLVLSNNNILGPYLQNIGVVRPQIGGMSVFSPDGRKFAVIHAEYQSVGALDIFDFDRCTGLLTNDIHIVLPQATSFLGGAAFSPNSRFLYAANIYTAYQYDMTSANIAASQMTVAVWDSFYSPSPPFSTGFEGMQLAPDGKIYIQTGNSTFHLHVINYPDSLGVACDFIQHGIQLQNWYVNGIPNHPNYFLGCDSTLGCGCLTDLEDYIPIKISARASPNPSKNTTTLQFPVQKTEGTLLIYNITGDKVGEELIAPGASLNRLI
ncbi:MAG: hypothetical protein IPJ79_08475 [Bacteroidetes bacterium]|nr:hypothetical protein [Bacteroidota bacterium]